LGKVWGNDPRLWGNFNKSGVINHEPLTISDNLPHFYPKFPRASPGTWGGAIPLFKGLFKDFPKYPILF